jgi:hypothetical protein
MSGRWHQGPLSASYLPLAPCSPPALKLCCPPAQLVLAGKLKVWAADQIPPACPFSLTLSHTVGLKARSQAEDVAQAKCLLSKSQTPVPPKKQGPGQAILTSCTSTLSPMALGNGPASPAVTSLPTQEI